MTPTDPQTLKASIDKEVRLRTVDGEYLVARIISVLDEESNPEVFYKLLSTSHPHLYSGHDEVAGYGIAIDQIVSVSPVT